MLILYKTHNQKKKKIIILSLRLHENKKMSKVMRTRTVLDLVKTLIYVGQHSTIIICL